MIEAAAINAVMRTLADPTRRAVFERIVGSDEITVVELTRGSGVTQGAISQHLKSLKQAGLVAERPEGRKREKLQGETRAHGLLCDFPIPRGIHDPKTAAAEKVIRIKSLGDPMCVPIPDRGRHERDEGKKPKFPTLKKALQ